MERSYSEEDAEAILRLATRETGGGIPESKLLQMAEELGISPEQLSRATAKYSAQKVENDERAEFQRHQRDEMRSHLSVYAVVNLFLFLIDFMRDQRVDWAFWPLLGWGIGVGCHVASHLFATDRDREQAFQKWRLAKTTGDRPDVRSLLDDAAAESVGKTAAVRRLRDNLGLTQSEAQAAVDRYDSENSWVFTVSGS